MKHSHKIYASLITVAILGGLFLMGPIQAAVLSLVSSSSEIIIGESFTMTSVFEFEPGDEINVSQFALDLFGPVSITCVFDVDGNKITSCEGITIKKLSEPSCNYGYCTYGYNPAGNWTFKFTINTINYSKGEYESEFLAFTDKGILRQSGPTIKFLENSLLLESCSIRARKGNLLVEEINFGSEGKLNFNIPKSNAVDGKGNLIAQKDKKRVVYKFDVDGIVSNNEDEAVFKIEGEYRFDRDKDILENAVVTIDKVNNKVSIVGPNITAKDMEITFLRGCV